MPKNPKKSTFNFQPEPKPFEKILFELIKKYVGPLKNILGVVELILCSSLDIYRSKYMNTKQLKRV